MSLLVGLRRAVFALLAIVQVAASPLAMLGEAQLVVAGAQRGHHSHIEDHSRPDCAPLHPDECVLCQFLAHVTPEGAPPRPPVFIARGNIAVPGYLHSQRASAARALERTRAPPIAI